MSDHSPRLRDPPTQQAAPTTTCATCASTKGTTSELPPGKAARPAAARDRRASRTSLCARRRRSSSRGPFCSASPRGHWPPPLCPLWFPERAGLGVDGTEPQLGPALASQQSGRGTPREGLSLRVSSTHPVFLPRWVLLPSGRRGQRLPHGSPEPITSHSQGRNVGSRPETDVRPLPRPHPLLLCSLQPMRRGAPR